MGGSDKDKPKKEVKTDQQLREQMIAHWDQQRYAEALEAVEAISAKDPFDTLNKGLLQWNLGQEESALSTFRESLRKKETATGYYYIASLLDQGKKWTSKWAERVPEITQHLERAIRMHGCPEGAYLLLDTVLWKTGGEANFRRRESTLKTGLGELPDSLDLRLRLAEVLTDRKDAEALTILAPLLADAQPAPKALWAAYKAAESVGRLEEAIEYLERLPGVPVPGVSAAKVIGDLWFELGRFEHAVKAYERDVSSSDPKASIVGLFSRAKVALKQWRANDALIDAMHAIELCFTQNLFEFSPPQWLCLPNDTSEFYDWATDIYTVCASLFDVNIVPQSDRPPHPFSGFAFILYKKASDELPDADKEEDKTEKVIHPWLQRAIEFEEHPAFLEEMANFYEDVDLEKALTYHLQYCLWFFGRKELVNAEKLRYRAHFYLPDDKKVTKKLAKALHDTCLKHLSDVVDSDLKRRVFVPLFETAWSELLGTAEMYKESAAVASRLLDVDPDNMDLWWKYSYGHDISGNKDIAETGYREILKRNPKNSSALHNLSIITGGKGQMEEAMGLSDAAAALSPENENIQKRNKSFDKIRAFQRLRETTRGRAPTFEELSLKHRVYLSAVLRCCMNEERTVIESVVDSGDKLSPNDACDEFILQELWNAGVLVVDPFSKADSLSLDASGACSVYIRKVRWKLNLRSNTGLTFPQMVDQVLDLPQLSPDTQTDEGLALWKEIAREEAIEYLEHRKNKVKLSSSLGEKTREYFTDLVEHFSTAQLYHIVHSAVRDSVTYQRENDLPDKHAANLIVKKCKTYGERALAQRWEVMGYRRDFECEQSIISKLLYNRVLGVGDDGFTLCPGRMPQKMAIPVSSEEKGELANPVS